MHRQSVLRGKNEGTNKLNGRFREHPIGKSLVWDFKIDTH